MTALAYPTTGLGQERVLRCQDQYGEDFDFSRAAEIIADDPGGYVH